MGALNWVVLFFTHPLEFRSLLQFYIYHEQKRDIKAIKEHPTSGWDRASMQRCWSFLDKTSRSFAAVIKELEGDLARTICLFYLVLRGLDTIEDDMTIPDDIKQPILRSFHKHTVTPGWTFSGCGPNEKDRQLLVEYDIVVEELNRLTPDYKAVIQLQQVPYTLTPVSEYDLYCHYVAGLVGEGLSRLFSKTNIIRDYREDVEQKRHFWPREIWGKHGFKEMSEMCAWEGKEGPEAEDIKRRATWVQSGMILDALRHSTDALDYLRVLKNQSVFNFCSIPAVMALATLALCYNNSDMFLRNIKIRKAEAAQLIMRSTNPREVGLIFRSYVRKIHAKCNPKDPYFIRISIACGKIEQWNEHHYPSFVLVVPDKSGSKPMLNTSDARVRILELENHLEAELSKKKRIEDIRAGITTNGVPNSSNGGGGEIEALLFVAGAMVLILGATGAVVWLVLRFF
ncbi:squalene synthase [Amanita rubescens]|nr:squalene synthase [Amanita rubescens]